MNDSRMELKVCEGVWSALAPRRLPGRRDDPSGPAIAECVLQIVCPHAGFVSGGARTEEAEPGPDQDAETTGGVYCAGVPEQCRRCTMSARVLVLPRLWATASLASAVGQLATRTPAQPFVPGRRKGPHSLRLVQAAAAAPAAQLALLPAPQPLVQTAPRALPVRPQPRLAFYRQYTEAMLRRYLKLSMEAGRVPSLIGQDMFRGNVSHCKVSGFDDVVIFIADVNRCLDGLGRRAKVPGAEDRDRGVHAGRNGGDAWVGSAHGAAAVCGGDRPVDRAVSGAKVAAGDGGSRDVVAGFGNADSLRE